MVKKHISTELIHAGDEHNSTSAVSMPIFQSSTFRFTDPDEIALAMTSEAHPQFYGRYATPNTKQVEATIAKLEGGDAALSVGSGVAATTLVLLSMLKTGDHLVTQNGLYPTVAKLISQKLSTLGIEATFVDQTDINSFVAAIKANTKMIYIESPVNPTLTLTDIAAVAELGKTHNIITVADNTFATPFNQQPLKLGIDIVLESATKYLAGHSDVVAGIIIANSEYISEMWTTHIMFGSVLHPMEAWLLQRGLQTFSLRMMKHNQSALEIAQYLTEHPAVREVYYPGLPSHPQYELARRQMRNGYSGVLSFCLRGGDTSAYEFLKHVKLLSLAVSLGSTHSLVTHPASTISQVQDGNALVQGNIPPGLVRLSVGLEDSRDVIADLEQALEPTIGTIRY